MPSYFRPELKKVFGYHLDQPAYSVKLNQNESPWDLPSSIKSVILQKLEEASWNRYPLPYTDDLCKKIADSFGHDPEGIIVTNGSNNLVKELILIANTKRPVLTVTPSFSLYEMESKLLGRPVVTVPLRDDFSLDLKLFLKTAQKIKPALIFIANPNAPTGNLFPEEDLLEIIKKTKALVVIDEAYFQFSGKTLLPHLPRFPNLVLLQTFSKAFSLAGARVGYALCHPHVAKELQKILLPFAINLFSKVVIETILGHQSWVAEKAREVVNERERLFGEMQKIKAITPYRSTANFILFRTKESQTLYKKLTTKGILIRDVSNKKTLKNCLRVSVGTVKENDQFLKALHSSL
ncbi:MAG: histidinol-phosphate transaminase [Deltaproteobacteria bacterium]|nr:histidinol-phosphate transaminase [Deltaproteobacteria bacterium]